MACSEGGEPVKRLSDIPLEIAERLDLPAESVAGVPKLTVTGRRRALVENHCGLLEYSHECIVVDGGRVRVCIRARTRQVLTGQTALTETEKQPAHGARTRWALRVGKKRINFYQNSGISDAECDKIIYEYPFAIRGVFTLPFSLVRERVQPYRTADAPVSEDAARASLEQALLQQLRETIGADGAIISYETAAETTGNVLTVTLTAECEQEIGRAQATPDAEFLQLRPPAGEGTTADD